MTRLYHFGHRPAPFHLPRPLYRVVACAPCAAAWLQPAYDYVTAGQPEAEACQICRYLEGLPEEAARERPVVAVESEPRQLRLFEEVTA